MWRVKYEQTEFAVELEKYGEEKSIPVVWLEVALGESSEARSGWWDCACMACGTAKTQRPRFQRPHSHPSSAGSLQVWELAFLCGKVFTSSLICWVSLCTQGRAADESVQPAAACVTDVPSLQQLQTLLGRDREAAVTVEVALAWILLSGPVPRSLAACFVLPPPSPLLCARECRKNNFLCNLATGNPIPDKL